MILSVTWANHYSALKNWAGRTAYDEFSLIGIDGVFLHYILKSEKNRSSADLVLPSIFSSFSLRVILVGSNEQNQIEILKQFNTQFPQVHIVKQMNGYDQLSSERLAEEILRENPEIVVVGLGPVKQEEFVIELLTLLQGRFTKDLLLVTCGGWLDQIMIDDYYPRFAYNFRLNWLVRLLREPRRLWKRYTIYAFMAWKSRRELRDLFRSLSGYINVENAQSEIELQLRNFLEKSHKMES